MDAVNSFLEICSVRKLSEVIQQEAITEMFSTCPTLQTYLHHAVPLIQRFLYTNYEEVYKGHGSENTRQVLFDMQFVQVCIYKNIV